MKRYAFSAALALLFTACGAASPSAGADEAEEDEPPSRPRSLPAGFWKTLSPNSGMTASTWSKTSDWMRS